MPVTMSLEISDRDLEHFRGLMNEAIKHAKSMAPEQIILNARQSLNSMQHSNSPDFSNERIDRLKCLIDAVEDEEWQIPEDEKQDILTSLAYFSEPHDLVPDHIPVLGFIDDAIMIELVLQELSLDLEAYQEFCGYRKSGLEKHGDAYSVNRASWLDEKRKEIQKELHRRKFARIRSRLFGPHIMS